MAFLPLARRRMVKLRMSLIGPWKEWIVVMTCLIEVTMPCNLALLKYGRAPSVQPHNTETEIFKNCVPSLKTE